MKDALYVWLYCLSLPLFLFNTWMSFVFAIGLAVAYSYDTPQTLLIIQIGSFLLLSLTSIILFIIQTIQMVRNKELSETLSKVTFVMLILAAAFAGALTQM